MAHLLNNIFVGAAVATCLVAGACNKKENGSGSKTTDSASSSDSNALVTAPNWKIEMVEDASVGTQVVMALGPGDRLGLAYFANSAYDDGICDEIEVNPPKRMRQSIFYAERAPGADNFNVEGVNDPVVIFEPSGLALAFNADGNPSIAFTGGIPEGQYCGGNDAVLATREGALWTTETAASTSGESATGIIGSDEGMVVGFWPGLAYSNTGDPAIIHKDVHFGALQSIDFRRADAEFAYRQGGSWIHEAIDPGDGAGDYGSLVFDADNRAVAFYSIPQEGNVDSRLGVWAARRTGPGTWDEKVQLFDGNIFREVASGINPETGALVVAFYSETDNAVRVRRLADMDGFTDESNWENEVVGNSVYDEGRYVSLAFTPAGNEVLAYHRCRLNSATTSGCDQNDEAAVVAIRSGGQWNIETIEEADLGSCGEYTAVVVDSTGVAHVAYRCTVNDGDLFDYRLYVASKPVEVP